MRADLFDKFVNEGNDPKSVARALNRLSTEVAWKKGITAGFLMLTLCDRLDCDINEEAQFRLTAIIRGSYDGARQALDGVRIKS